MDLPLHIQFSVSAVAIILLALVAWWARIPRQIAPLDETSARAVIAEELPDLAIDAVWVDAARTTAIARAGDEGVVLFRVGDGFAVRELPWAKIARPKVANGQALFRFGDPGAPSAAFKLSGATPPFAETAA